ncbi:mitochondrial ribosomal subunit S27-domain-containing protein [Durotheca rogersii]|uniref:mitochondrial ribosomal subunit S27-domain-containing protein n=1 Tax=Durotheca rogersii TaxID=419775 RepID=UPI002220EA0B|nr:mitochondrial ribosomal subunit S27-domain-containing protein [Durotheca rogersii]KAI5864181.1 mitochondrial ribosomal subunit S27-domain-containing protein [Durotheca rogersii]
MALVSRARLLDLMKIQCQIFSSTYNPGGIRMGNKILRQRLKGPSLAKYYPSKKPTIFTLEREFEKLDLWTLNEEEMDRQEHIAGRKSRGKGAPKKRKGPIAKHLRGKK